MTNQLQAVTVYEINIVNGKPIAIPTVTYVDPEKRISPDDGIELYPSDAMQEESARLNQMFNQGYF